MADEIKNLNQAISDAVSALDAKQQEIADSSAVKNTQISDLKTEASVKDARIAELEAAAAAGIDPAGVTAATTQVQALTADIASTPTT